MDIQRHQIYKLLEISGISRIYFIDDYLPSEIEIEKSLTALKITLEDKGLEFVLANLSEVIDLKRTPESEIVGKVREEFERGDLPFQRKLSESIRKLANGDFLEQTKTVSKVIEFIKDAKPIEVHPSKWKEIKNNDLKTDLKNGKVLILMDKDLSNAAGFEKIDGVRLIQELKEFSNYDNIICILISNDIKNLKDELPTRKDLVKEFGLEDSDFFPLSKQRLELADLFYDGIKKSLLNSRCEFIKNESSNIIKESFQKTIERLQEIDTYDFDHTIFRSSYTEGIWEGDTLLRLAGVIFDNEIKKQMVSSNFQKNVNIHIRESKKISDFRFDLNVNSSQPYKEKYELRHSDLYESGSIINPLFRPISNGDIFDLYSTESSEKGLYILIGQDCDLALRNPSGKRESTIAHLFKIESLNFEQFRKLKAEHYKEKERDFHDAKFILDYLNPGTNDKGIINFKNSILIDFRIIDITVFNANGELIFDLDNEFDTSVLSFAWEKRYKSIQDFLNKKSGWALRVYHGLKGIRGDNEKDQIREHLTSLNRLKLSLFRPELGNKRTLKKNVYNFGMRRVMHFKEPGSNVLLDKYSKYHSRFPTPHDFLHIE